MALQSRQTRSHSSPPNITGRFYVTGVMTKVANFFPFIISIVIDIVVIDLAQSYPFHSIDGTTILSVDGYLCYLCFHDLIFTLIRKCHWFNCYYRHDHDYNS